MLAGFGVMGLGRHHPVVRKALHDVLDAGLADLTRFDCPPLPGLLAEKLLVVHARTWTGCSSATAAPRRWRPP